MPVSPPDPLVRTNYLSWPPGPYLAEADPDNPSYDPSLVLPSGGVPSNGNMATDEEQYLRPLERVHGMALHAPGVGWGMDIACTIGSSGVLVASGIALDASGKHIYLAQGGNAEIGPDADVPGTPADLTPVTPSGAALPTVGFTGTYYVAVQWWETWDSAAYASDGVNQYNDTPWLQLITSGEYDPDLHVVLGKLVLDVSGNVTAVSYGNVGGLQRTNVSIPVQSVQLQRAANTGSTGANSATWGEVRSAENGGIEIVTKSMSNAVNVIAGQAAFGVESNPGIVLDANDATATIGNSGIDGFVRMQNDSAAETLYLDGKTGTASVQNLNAFQNGLINVNTTFFRCHGTDLCLDGRSHNNNRALVDWGNLLIVNYDGDYRNGVEIQGSGLNIDQKLTVGGSSQFNGNTVMNDNLTVEKNLTVDGTIFDGNGVPLEGNPARKVTTTFPMSAGSDYNNVTSSVTADIDLGSSKHFSAFILPHYLQEYVDISYNAASATEVLEVDGNGTPVIATLGISGAGDPNLHVAAFSGVGRIITFRTRGMDDSIEIFATGIVYFE